MCKVLGSFKPQKVVKNVVIGVNRCQISLCLIVNIFNDVFLLYKLVQFYRKGTSFISFILSW